MWCRLTWASYSYSHQVVHIILFVVYMYCRFRRTISRTSSRTCVQSTSMLRRRWSGSSPCHWSLGSSLRLWTRTTPLWGAPRVRHVGWRGRRRGRISKLWFVLSLWIIVASSPGHSQILSRSRGAKSVEGLGSLLHHGPEMVDSVST